MMRTSLSFIKSVIARAPQAEQNTARYVKFETAKSLKAFVERAFSMTVPEEYKLKRHENSKQVLSYMTSNTHRSTYVCSDTELIIIGIVEPLEDKCRIKLILALGTSEELHHAGGLRLTKELWIEADDPSRSVRSNLLPTDAADRYHFMSGLNEAVHKATARAPQGEDTPAFNLRKLIDVRRLFEDVIDMRLLNRVHFTADVKDTSTSKPEITARLVHPLATLTMCIRGTSDFELRAPLTYSSSFIAKADNISKNFQMNHQWVHFDLVIEDDRSATPHMQYHDTESINKQIANIHNIIIEGGAQ